MSSMKRSFSSIDTPQDMPHFFVRREYRPPARNVFNVAKADYIPALRLLLQKFNAIFAPFEHQPINYFDPDSFHYKCHRLRHSIRYHLYRLTHEAHNDRGTLPEIRGYEWDIAKAWYGRKVDSLWVYCFEAVAQRFRSRFGKVLYEEPEMKPVREKAKEQAAFDFRDFKTGGIRVLMLRRQFLKKASRSNMRLVREFRGQVTKSRFPKPRRIHRDYTDPVPGPSIRLPSTSKRGPSKLNIVENVYDVRRGCKLKKMRYPYRPVDRRIKTRELLTASQALETD